MVVLVKKKGDELLHRFRGGSMKFPGRGLWQDVGIDICSITRIQMPIIRMHEAKRYILVKRIEVRMCPSHKHITSTDIKVTVIYKSFGNGLDAYRGKAASANSSNRSRHIERGQFRGIKDGIG